MAEQIPEEDQVDTMSFAWWLGMLPFLCASGFFIWQWSRHEGNVNIAYAVASLLAGLVLAAAVTAGSSGGDGDSQAQAGGKSDSAGS
jgi:hypothetical protein